MERKWIRWTAMLAAMCVFLMPLPAAFGEEMEVQEAPAQEETPPEETPRESPDPFVQGFAGLKAGAVVFEDGELSRPLGELAEAGAVYAIPFLEDVCWVALDSPELRAAGTPPLTGYVLSGDCEALDEAARQALENGLSGDQELRWVEGPDGSQVPAPLAALRLAEAPEVPKEEDPGEDPQEDPEEDPKEDPKEEPEETPQDDPGEDLLEERVSQGVPVDTASASPEKILKGAVVTFTADTDAAAEYLALTAENGKIVKTWPASGNSTVSGATRTWKVKYAVASAGNRRLGLKASTDGQSYGAAKVVRIVVLASLPVSSVEADPTTSVKGQAVTFTAVTPADAAFLAMYAEKGGRVKTWNAEDFSVLQGEERVWTVRYAIASPGLRRLTFKASMDNARFGQGMAVEVNVLASIAVESASATPEAALKGKPVTFTVRTPAVAAYLRMYAENGSGVKTWTAEEYSTVDGDTRVWQVQYAIGRAGSRRLTFKASADNRKFGPGMQVAIQVSASLKVTAAAAEPDVTARGKPVTFTIKTTAAALYLRMFSEGGGAVKTWAAEESSTVEGDTRTWTVQYSFAGAGNRRMVFRPSCDKKTFVPGMAVRVQVLASEAELEAPRVLSAEAAAPETTLGSDMLFRVVTSADAAYLAVYDASGNLVHKAENGEAPAEGGERAWTMILPMERTGDVKLTFRASADDAVFGLAATAQLTVKDGEFVYQIDETLGGAVLAAYKGASAIVEVPASYCGLPMVKIGQSAFEGNDAIQEVFLPESVEVIGRRAFKNCKNMKDMD